MSVAIRLEQLLEESGAPFDVIDHPLAFTAQEEAASSHVSGRHWAKTVAVLIDGDPALAVLPATRRLDIEKLRRVVGTDSVEIAREAEFQDLYPDCELGAMPPFGELYGQRRTRTSSVWPSPSRRTSRDPSASACEARNRSGRVHIGTAGAS